MITQSGRKPRHHALAIWEPRPDNPSIDRETELRLVRRHGLGQTSRYGAVRSPGGVWPIEVTIWPESQRPDDPDARRHASGHWYKVEIAE